jgi:hypothetical protein
MLRFHLAPTKSAHWLFFVVEQPVRFSPIAVMIEIRPPQNVERARAQSTFSRSLAVSK